MCVCVCVCVCSLFVAREGEGGGEWGREDVQVTQVPPPIFWQVALANEK